MINEAMLRETLIRLVEQVKTQYAVSSVLMGEVRALREAVRGLDPTFDDVMAMKREQNPIDVLSQETAPQLDEIIRLLKAGLIL